MPTHFRYRSIAAPQRAPAILSAATPLVFAAVFLALIGTSGMVGALIGMLLLVTWIAVLVPFLFWYAGEVEVHHDLLTWRAPLRTIRIPLASVERIGEGRIGALIHTGGRQRPLPVFIQRRGFDRFVAAMAAVVPAMSVESGSRFHRWSLRDGFSERPE